jgi:hypothetical protein
MPRFCSHSAGFAKGKEAGAQSSEWKNETAKSEVSSKLFPMRSWKKGRSTNYEGGNGEPERREKG